VRVSREKDDDRRLMHWKIHIHVRTCPSIYVHVYTTLYDLAREPPRTADRIVDVGCDCGEAARCAPARRSFLLLYSGSKITSSPLAPTKGAIKFLGILDDSSFYSRVDKETSPFSPVGKRHVKDLEISSVRAYSSCRGKTLTLTNWNNSAFRICTNVRSY